VAYGFAVTDQGRDSGNPPLPQSTLDALIEAARTARIAAYAPYSGYQVGAALLDAQGRSFTGVNVENSAYPTCVCAETNALGTGVTQGAQSFVAIAICTEPSDNGELGAPCGNCRQALSEFGLDLTVVLVGPTGDPEVIGLRDLLPHAFSSKHL